MAVIWQKHVDGKSYEVRAAGQTRRLYTDGVFHSQYNPGRQLTGNVWDLLSLPSFFLEPDRMQRALVLGVGGGTVLRQLRHWYPNLQVTGIEFNPIHLYIAKRFFQLDDPQLTLVEADAIEWMQCYDGPAFDLIVDDLFFEEEGEPCRAVSANRHWLQTLTDALSAHGMLSMNFIANSDLRDSAVFHNRRLQSRFKNVYRFTTPLYENAIGVFLSQPQTLNQLLQRIAEQPTLQAEFMEKRGKYQIRKLRY